MGSTPRPCRPRSSVVRWWSSRRRTMRQRRRSKRWTFPIAFRHICLRTRQAASWWFHRASRPTRWGRMLPRWLATSKATADCWCSPRTRPRDGCRSPTRSGRQCGLPFPNSMAQAGTRPTRTSSTAGRFRPTPANTPFWRTSIRSTSKHGLQPTAALQMTHSSGPMQSTRASPAPTACCWALRGGRMHHWSNCASAREPPCSVRPRCSNIKATRLHGRSSTTSFATSMAQAGRCSYAKETRQAK